MRFFARLTLAAAAFFICVAWLSSALLQGIYICQGPNCPQVINGVTLSGNTFVGGAASGTVVGTISVAMSPASPAFSGSLTLTGTNASSFQVVGSNLQTSGVVPVGTYQFNIVATQSGAVNSPFQGAVQVTGTTAVAGIAMSCGSSCAFNSGTAGTVGTASATLNSGSFTGTWTLATSGTDHAGTTCNNYGANFTIGSGTGVLSNSSGAPAQAYPGVCVVATQAGLSNSPYTQAITVTGNSSVTFPLSVNSGVLTTKSGAPFLIFGDSPQGANSLPLCSAGNTYALCSASADTLPTNATFVAYIKDRQTQGFNSIWINILCESYTSCNSNGSMQEGTFPFTTQLNGTGYPGGANYVTDTCPENGSINATPNDVDCWDMSSGINVNGTATGTNAAYWTHVDGYFKLAADHGIQVFAGPISTDACNNRTANANSNGAGSMAWLYANNNTLKVANINLFADFLYARYGNPASANYAPNLVWWIGNDYNCWDSVNRASHLLPGIDNVVFAFASRLHTDELASSSPHIMMSAIDGLANSLTDTVNPWQNVVNINGSYYVGAMYDGALLAHAQNSTTIPPMVVEDQYAGEDFDGIDDGTVPPQPANITGCDQFSLGGNNNQVLAGDPNACPFRERAQFWQFVLAGGYAGYLGGNHYTWTLTQGWNNGAVVSTSNTCTGTSGTGHSPCLDLISNTNLKNAVAFLKNNIAWYTLIPDVTRVPDANGYGTGTWSASPLVLASGCYPTNNCAQYYIGQSYAHINDLGQRRGTLQNLMPVSGVTSDGLAGIVYVTGISSACTYYSTFTATNCVKAGGQQFTVNNAKITGSSGVTAAWYDPSGPMTSPVSVVCSPTGTPCSGTTQVYTSPAASSHTDTATSDWVLLLTSSGAAAPAFVSVGPATPSFTAPSTNGATLEVLISTMSSGSFTGSYSLTSANGGCASTDNASFAISGSNLNFNAALGAGTYHICVRATQTGASNSPFDTAFTITASGVTQTPSSIAIGSNGCTGTACRFPNSDTAMPANSGCPGTNCYIGTLSTTLSAGAPPFSGSYTVVASGTNCTAGSDTTHFSINGTDSLQATGSSGLPAASGTPYNVCVRATSGANSTTQGFTVTVGHLINASALCAANGGGTGTSGSPWQAACIQAAVNAAVNGDTIFLAAGHWELKILSTEVVTGNKNVSIIGAGSGNTFDAFGHPNNGNGTPVGTIGPGGNVTRVFVSGTTGPGGGYLTMGLYGQIGSTGCASANPGPTLAHLFSDGSLTQTQGHNNQTGDINAVISIQSCDNVTINDIRVLQCCVGTIVSVETQFFVQWSHNNVIKNSVFAVPVFSGTTYSNAQALQTQSNRNPVRDNNIFYQQSYNSIYEEGVTFTRNYTFFGCDALGCNSDNGQQGYTGCSTAGCVTGGNVGSTGYFARNNQWNSASGNAIDFGGGVNDPSTEGTVNDIELTGNWLIAGDAVIDSCESHFFGGCLSSDPTSGAGMQVNGLTATNNSIIGSSTAQLWAEGTGCGNQGSGPNCPASSFPHQTMVNYAASQNYLQSPNNQYKHDAFTITPSVSNNFCSGSTFSGCNTTGFTTLPTVSFTLGPLAGAVVPFATETFTAQYGAVQWLASTSPTAPLSNDTRWRSNNANSAGNTYLAPVSLAATHGSTVYMWVMDSANHIAAATPVAVP